MAKLQRDKVEAPVLAENYFTFRNNYIFSSERERMMLALGVWVSCFKKTYIETPRNFKIHRSSHYMVFGILSLYIPYRYDQQLNTALFLLSKSKSPWLNLLLRLPAKVIIYASSVFLGQLAARQYWTVKKVFSAS